MILTLNNGERINVSEITERYTNTREGEVKKNIIIRISDELTFEDISSKFTPENISNMSLDTEYKEGILKYTSTELDNIEVSVLEGKVYRTVYLY